MFSFDEDMSESPAASSSIQLYFVDSHTDKPDKGDQNEIPN